jgi:hypothetical protein
MRRSTVAFAALFLLASAASAADGDGQDTARAGERPAETLADERDTEREALEPAVPAMDRLELETTEVTGNRELPRVLYIVPWRKAAPGDLGGRPVNSLIEEVLAPLDREEFIRQVDYYSDLADAATGEDFEVRR